MSCKDFIKYIREELSGSMGYYWKQKELKEDGHVEESKYVLNMAMDELEHAKILMKMLDDHIAKKVADDKYTGIYKELYEMSIEVLKDEYSETETLIKKD